MFKETNVRNCNIYSGDDDCSVLYGRFREFYRIRSMGAVYNEHLDLDGDANVDLDDLLIFLQNQEESWCADQVAFISEAVEHAFTSPTQSFNIGAPEVPQEGPSQEKSPMGGLYDIENKTEEENLTVEELFQEEESEEFEEQRTTNGEETTGPFDIISGAVTGVGDSLGIGSTLAYLFLCLVFISGIVFVFRKIN